MFCYSKWDYYVHFLCTAQDFHHAALSDETRPWRSSVLAPLEEFPHLEAYKLKHWKKGVKRDLNRQYVDFSPFLGLP